MAWFILMLAGILEIGWVLGIKYGLLYPWRGPLGLVNWMLVLSLLVSVGSISLLALSMHNNAIPMGTAYAVWTGIGTLGAAILGMVLFKEPADAWRIAFIALILIGIVGLKLTMTVEPAAP
jgi:quaternary ammonium compound-resistance protein SugE